MKRLFTYAAKMDVYERERESEFDSRVLAWHHGALSFSYRGQIDTVCLVERQEDATSAAKWREY